jgi:hypothetical protein
MPAARYLPTNRLRSLADGFETGHMQHSLLANQNSQYGANAERSRNRRAELYRLQFSRFYECINEPVDRGWQIAPADQCTQFHVPLEGCLGEIGAAQECNLRVRHRNLDVHQPSMTLFIPRTAFRQPLQQRRPGAHHASQLVTLAVDLLSAV